jgi:hypothetical protein
VDDWSSKTGNQAEREKMEGMEEVTLGEIIANQRRKEKRMMQAQRQMRW